MGEFKALACVLLLSIPAVLTAQLTLVAVDPLMVQGAGLALVLGGSAVGLFLVERMVRRLRTSVSDQPLILWTPRQWGTYIRVAQLTGIVLVLLTYYLPRR